MKALKFAALALTLNALPALAGVTDNVGTWRGDGAVFDIHGKQIGQYSVEMVNEAVDASTVSSTVVVMMENGAQLKVLQTLRDGPGNSFGIESSMGDGGGYCFGEGLCQSYVGEVGGSGFAMAIVKDGPNGRRYLRTELEAGKAIRFYREKLTRF